MWSFNPQARAGPDNDAIGTANGAIVSIRRPVRGLTWYMSASRGLLMFQSAGPCGA